MSEFVRLEEVASRLDDVPIADTVPEGHPQPSGGAGQ